MQYSYNRLKEFYNQKDKYCETGQLGSYYIPSKMVKIPWRKKDKTIFIDGFSKEKIVDIRCNSYNCKRCRPILKNRLHENIQREVYIWDIDKHMVITAPGKPFRNKISWDKSYKILNYDFNKLIHRIYYEIEKIKQGKITRSKNPLLKDNVELPNNDFSYIVLPRAQAKPKENNPIGFCHLHTLINYPINKEWIYEKVEKNNYKFGWNFIRKNKSVADYLCLDFFDDDEWVIPFKTRHYRSSRNIKINMEYEKDKNIIYMDKNYQNVENVLENVITEYDIFGKNFKVKNNIILPNEEYVIKFNELQDIKNILTKETKMTSTGIQNKYRTENKIFIENMGYT